MRVFLFRGWVYIQNVNKAKRIVSLVQGVLAWFGCSDMLVPFEAQVLVSFGN